MVGNIELFSNVSFKHFFLFLLSEITDVFAWSKWQYVNIGSNDDLVPNGFDSVHNFEDILR